MPRSAKKLVARALAWGIRWGDSPRPPRLFGSERDVVPEEVANLIVEAAAAARCSRGEIDADCGFQGEGVEIMAGRMLDELRQKYLKAPPGRPAKLPPAVAAWCYALLAYCTEYGEPVPPTLLWLLFEALALREGAPPPEILDAMGLPGGIGRGQAFHLEKVEAFMFACWLDGRADAKGAPLSLAALARMTSVSRTTLRRWRTTAEYVARRRSAAVGG